MGKEIKIGLAIIFILVITFGIVLAKRLSGTTDRSSDSVAAKEGQQAPGTGSESAGQNAHAKISAAIIQEPTMLAANARSARPPNRSRNMPSQWTGVTDRGAATQSTDYEPDAPSPSQSMMPKVSTPIAVDPYDRYGNARQQSTQASDTYDPFGNQRPRAGGRDLEQPDTMEQTPSSLKVMGPPPRPPRDPDTGEYVPQGSQGYYPSPNAPTQQMLAYRPRYGSERSTPSAIVEQTAISRGPSNGGSLFDAEGLRNEDGEYEIQPNDSYWTISEKLYGSGAYFKALAEHNRSNVPRENRLDVGDVIAAPSLSELEKTHPGLCPKPSRRDAVRSHALAVGTRGRSLGGRTYTVEEGDTLFDIARYELGKASRWIDIHDLNRDVLGKDYDYLTPGIELILPNDRTNTDSVTRRPGADSLYQR